MIKSINGSPYVSVSAGMMSVPYMTNTPSAGMMRYNPSTSNVEVYDGTIWHIMSTHATVDLSPDVKELLSWARNKRQEDIELKQMIDTNPAVRDLYEKLEMTKVLVRRQQEEQNS